MRPVSATVLGAGLVVAGLLAPAPGEVTSASGDALVVRPGVTRPGERIAISIPGCGGLRATSEVFAGRTADGEATVKHSAEPGTYAVVAHCGSRKVTGEVRVTDRPPAPARPTDRLRPTDRIGWPDLLPTGRGIG